MAEEKKKVTASEPAKALGRIIKGKPKEEKAPE